MNLNKVILIGRLTREPELKSLPSGQPVAGLGLATDRYFTDKSGQKQRDTEFHNVVLFGKLAEIASKYLNKGSLVMIEGHLRTRNWQDSSGKKQYRTEIIAERLQLGPKSASQEISEKEMPPQEDIPIIEEENEIDVKDIPF